MVELAKKGVKASVGWKEGRVAVTKVPFANLHMFKIIMIMNHDNDDGDDDDDWDYSVDDNDNHNFSTMFVL